MKENSSIDFSDGTMSPVKLKDRKKRKLVKSKSIIISQIYDSPNKGSMMNIGEEAE